VDYSGGQRGQNKRPIGDPINLSIRKWRSMLKNGCHYFVNKLAEHDAGKSLQKNRLKGQRNNYENL